MHRITPTAAVALLLLLPPVAAAHGLGGEASGTSTLGFVPLGIEHMLLGWDHLLFIVGVVLLAGRFDRAAKLITTFVVGHSTTLILATVNEWRLDPDVVDVMIALSVLAVGVIGLRGRPERWAPVHAMVAVFGLIHGFGLATRLLDLGVPDDGLLAKTIAFNVGLEIGQIAAIAVIVGGLLLAARLLGERWEPARRVLYGGLAVAGIVAAVVLALGSGDEKAAGPVAAGTPTTTAAAGQAACTQVDERAASSFAGGHPAKNWYGPGEIAPVEDFGHVLGDGYAIVRYADGLPASQVEQLRRMVDGSGKAIAGGEDTRQREAVTVTTLFRRLTCTRFDAAAIARFNERWFADLRAGRFG